jgi:hypothetical protein
MMTNRFPSQLWAKHVNAVEHCVYSAHSFTTSDMHASPRGTAAMHAAQVLAGSNGFRMSTQTASFAHADPHGPPHPHSSIK